LDAPILVCRAGFPNPAFLLLSFAYWTDDRWWSVLLASRMPSRRWFSGESRPNALGQCVPPKVRLFANRNNSVPRSRRGPHVAETMEDTSETPPYNFHRIRAPHPDLPSVSRVPRHACSAQKQRREAEEKPHARHVGHGRQENARGRRRIRAELLQRQRHQHAR